jgi:hypothetical protein
VIARLIFAGVTVAAFVIVVGEGVRDAVFGRPAPRGRWSRYHEKGGRR